jgi:hypothetical protein
MLVDVMSNSLVERYQLCLEINYQFNLVPRGWRQQLHLVCWYTMLPNHTAVNTLKDYNLKLYHGTWERENTRLFEDNVSSLE